MTAEPLPIEKARRLAQRFAYAPAALVTMTGNGERVPIPGMRGRDNLEPLTGPDRERLFAWVRGRMNEQKNGAAWLRVSVGPPPLTTRVYDRRKLAYVVGLHLGGAFECGPEDEPGLTYNLCEAAGWPS